VFFSHITRIQILGESKQLDGVQKLLPTVLLSGYAFLHRITCRHRGGRTEKTKNKVFHGNLAYIILCYSVADALGFLTVSIGMIAIYMYQQKKNTVHD